MITTIEYIKGLPEPYQIESQEQELEYLTIDGNVNTFCPHCGYVLWNGIENNNGTCEHCYGLWVKKKEDSISMESFNIA
jgi:hypothetical protein